MWLWRWGINAGAEEAVAAFRPTLKGRENITDAELRVWWAPREMKRMSCDDIAFDIIDEQPRTELPIKIEGVTGYSLYLARRHDTSDIVMVSAQAKAKKSDVERGFMRGMIHESLAILEPRRRRPDRLV